LQVYLSQSPQVGAFILTLEEADHAGEGSYVSIPSSRGIHSDYPWRLETIAREAVSIPSSRGIHSDLSGCLTMPLGLIVSQSPQVGAFILTENG